MPDSIKPLCGLCGLPMPPGETMFKFHGYSGPCPGPAMPRATTATPPAGVCVAEATMKDLDVCDDERSTTVIIDALTTCTKTRYAFTVVRIK
jgi:hypothetical protein